MKTIRMPKESAQKWFAALRSGQYRQGFGELYADSRYCCLGVLEHCLTGEVENVGDGLPSLEWLKRNHITFLTKDPEIASKNAAYTPMTARAPVLPSERNSEGFIMNAAEANDYGYSFERLAALLEQATEYTDEEPSQVTKE